MNEIEIQAMIETFLKRFFQHLECSLEKTEFLIANSMQPSN